jgi:hypothetical protein
MTFWKFVGGLFTTTFDEKRLGLLRDTPLSEGVGLHFQNRAS